MPFHASNRPASRALPAMILALGLALVLLVGGCAYYNTFYHARQFYEDAQRLEEADRKGTSASVSGAFSTPSSNDPRLATQKAAAGTQAGNARANDLYSKCIDKCKKVIENYPGSRWQDDAYLLMAKAYYGKGEYLAASRELARFPSRFPESNLLSEALFWQGLTAYAQDDRDEARKLWADLLQQYPKSDEREDARYYMAEALQHEDETEPAVQAYRDFLKEFPKGDRAVAARMELGRLLLEENQYEEAEGIFRHLASKAPEEEDRLQARLLLGESLEDQDKNEDALALYQDVEQWLDPDVLKGRMTAEERERLEDEARKVREAAAQDSAFKAKMGLIDTTRTNNPATRTQNPNTDQFGNPLPGTQNPNTDQFGNPLPGTQNPNTDQFGNPLPGTQNPNTDQFGNPLPGTQNPNTDQFGNPVTNPAAQTAAQTQTGTNVGVNPTLMRQTLPTNDPKYKQLAQVILREGTVLADLGRPWDAILAFEQVLAEYPRTTFASEAQYRIGYTYEVDLEDFDRAQDAYNKVATQGRSAFSEDAEKRAKNLSTVKNLMAAASDSASQATASAAQARFLRAELYLFQQDKPERALEEYQGIEKDFAGTEHEAKAALAEAWVRMNALADTARGRAKYADVMRRFPDTEYGRRASRILKGPEREPAPTEFMGPSEEALRDPLNVASVNAREDSLFAAATAVQDSIDAVGKAAADADSLAARAGMPAGEAGAGRMPGGPNGPPPGATPGGSGQGPGPGGPPVGPAGGNGRTAVAQVEAGTPGAPGAPGTPGTNLFSPDVSGPGSDERRPHPLPRGPSGKPLDPMAVPAVDAWQPGMGGSRTARRAAADTVASGRIVPAAADSLRAPVPADTGQAPAPADTAGAPVEADTSQAPAPADTLGSPAPADTTHAAAPPDTLGAPAPADTSRAPAKADSLRGPQPDGGPAPGRSSALPAGPDEKPGDKSGPDGKNPPAEAPSDTTRHSGDDGS